MVFMLNYDGRGLRILDTGSKMYGLTLDNTGAILYYHGHKKLKRYDLALNVTVDVVTL